MTHPNLNKGLLYPIPLIKTSLSSRVVDVDSEYISDGVGDRFRVTSPPMYPPPPPVTATKTQPQIPDSVMSQGT